MKLLNLKSLWCLFILILLLSAFATPVPEAWASENKPELPDTQKNYILEEAALLSGDIDKAFGALKTLAPAITFLGGARIREGDRYCTIAVETGSLLAGYGVPICTGGGTGIMEFIPQGYLKTHQHGTGNTVNPFTSVRSTVSTGAKSDDCRTQAFIIKLPKEQKANPFIEVFTELKTLPIRKLALMENKTGFGFFPGGFGTMDEFYELWDLKCRRELSVPVALVGTEFWQEQLTALEEAAVKSRRLITGAELLMVSDSTVDEPSQIISALSRNGGSGDIESDPERKSSLLRKDIQKASEYYVHNKDAVVFLGSPGIFADDITCAVARSVSLQCAHRGIALRTGDGGNVARAVAYGAREGSEKAEIQAFLLQSDIIPAEIPGIEITTVQSTVIHKAFISKKMRALLVLPGDVHTFSELFGILCLMQNNMIGRKPVILIGKSFWTPFVSVLKKTMCQKERMLIAPDDLSLITITDSPREAMELIAP
ncbi:MAG: LOG family protein [Vulcanimicrobiota bacterium]